LGSRGWCSSGRLAPRPPTAARPPPPPAGPEPHPPARTHGGGGARTPAAMPAARRTATQWGGHTLKVQRLQGGVVLQCGRNSLGPIVADLVVWVTGATVPWNGAARTPPPPHTHRGAGGQGGVHGEGGRGAPWCPLPRPACSPAPVARTTPEGSPVPPGVGVRPPPKHPKHPITREL
jgi:hypothetical protein